MFVDAYNMQIGEFGTIHKCSPKISVDGSVVGRYVMRVSESILKTIEHGDSTWWTLNMIDPGDITVSSIGRIQFS